MRLMMKMFPLVTHSVWSFRFIMSLKFVPLTNVNLKSDNFTVSPQCLQFLYTTGSMPASQRQSDEAAV